MHICRFRGARQEEMRVLTFAYDDDCFCPEHMEPKRERSVMEWDVEKWELRPKRVPTFEELYVQLNRVEYSPSTSGVATFVNPHNKTVNMKYPHSSIWYNGDEIMERVVKELLPQKIEFIVEVGSMNGGSAIRMALELDKRGLRTVPILCIDPWTGDLNMWLNGVVWDHLGPIGGRGTSYDQFMVNVKGFISDGMSDRHIIPFAVSSNIGARWLQATGFTPNLIYLDSAHEEDETYMELCLYWELLAKGGILMGDDYGWAGVKHDVDRFVADRDLKLNMFGVHYNWWIKKE